MRRTPVALLAVGLAATAASLVPAAQASAADAGTSLVLSKVFSGPTPGEKDHSVTLQCEPTGGSHPTPDAACASLIAVDGQFAKLPTVWAACPATYDPVTVSVSGTWHFKTVSFTQTYTNDCAAGVLSDYVFRF
ncbi:SSI family serine proteinase inhibitor [Streptomyces sp. NRRL F-5123]|uniref:SSI family serine proteinase inhibitor n=1 Tax=Streptomyces sp. NRRL F-5123 TaxID=1463856 RepID=UPI0007C5ABF6|nr:SSI family serine proteinase inhibitor [Streptomyces sp. NRRL F-5123]